MSDAARAGVAVGPERGLPRALEVTAALVALGALLPLLALLALLVRLTSRGPALFRQLRVGRGGAPFHLLKLRTMRRATGAEPGTAVTAAGDPRITPLGRLLRAAKLDEIPQLWNVARGELSWVGPRPEVPVYVDLDDPAWRRVLAVRPGLTHPVTLALRDEEGILAAARAGGGDVDAFYRDVLVRYKLHGYSAYEDRRSAGSDLLVLLRTLLALVGIARPTRPTAAELRQP